jgi:hypothetical protein
MMNVLGPLRRLLALPALCAACCALHACVDTSPIDYHAAAVMDGGIADAASINSDAARVAECKQCVTHDSCSTEYGKCEADSRCAAWYDCLLDSYCVNFPSDLSKLPPCLTACAVKAMVFSSDDPIIPLFRGVLFCTEDKCVEPCDIPK